MPANGFYDTGPKNARQPLRFHRADGGLIPFAGFYESWFLEKNHLPMTLTIITCAPNAAMAPIHDRMRVVLDERGADDWVNPLERDPLSLKRLLIPAPDDALVRLAGVTAGQYREERRRGIAVRAGGRAMKTPGEDRT